MSTSLTHSNYGKSRVRLVKVARHEDRHDLQDITVHIAFEGDFELAHTLGDNSKVLPTDTMKNTVYALAKEAADIEQIEDFALRLSDHFLKNNAQASRVTIKIEENIWTRIAVAGTPHHHSFAKSSDEKRTTKIVASRERLTIESGLENLLVLKTTNSSFEGFLKDQYTTLKETDDRIFATAIKATWLYTRPEAASGALWRGVRQTILETFATHESLSVQHTLYAMGETVLTKYQDILEIGFSLPNKHCLLVDLAPFGLESKNEIFVPTDEPHGLIEARVGRK
jgi:urate oxidase